MPQPTLRLKQGVKKAFGNFRQKFFNLSQTQRLLLIGMVILLALASFTAWNKNRHEQCIQLLSEKGLSLVGLSGASNEEVREKISFCSRLIYGLRKAPPSPAPLTPTDNPYLKYGSTSPFPSSSPSPTPKSVKYQIKISTTPTGFLRVRKEPTTFSEELGKVYSGETYPVLYARTDSSGTWLQIQYKPDVTGWITEAYTEKAIEE